METHSFCQIQFFHHVKEFIPNCDLPHRPTPLGKPPGIRPFEKILVKLFTVWRTSAPIDAQWGGGGGGGRGGVQLAKPSYFINCVYIG